LKLNATITPDHRLTYTVSAVGLLLGCALLNPPEDIAVRESLLKLAITEINYHPLDEGTIVGDAYEFIELKNTGTTSVSLNDVAFSDGIEYAFAADARIEANQSIVLAANDTAFTKRYGFAPFGVYAGKLSNSGERLALTDLLTNEEFLQVRYGDQSPWPAAADGGGYTLVPQTTDLSGDPTTAGYWRCAFHRNGSPGADDPGVVYINEVLTHTDPPLTDAIELYNPNATPVDIGGWFLTDRKLDPAKFRIPTGTVIGANGYLVFYDTDFDADPTAATAFRLSEHGEEVYLFADSTGTREGGYCHGFTFGEISNGVSFGRYISGDGGEHLVAQQALTLGEANAGPQVGPLVISEIMYNPPDGRYEYIEIRNISDQTMALYDPAYPQNTWKVDGFGFSFPQGESLQSGKVALIISDTVSVQDFRTRYGVAVDVTIFASSGSLDNGGETVALRMPSEPYIDSSQTPPAEVVPYALVDQVSFNDGGVWPSEADSSGLSLQRINPNAFGDDAQNWRAAAPSPGR
jgi:hypothetical protein